MVEDIAQVQGEIVTLGLRQENFEQHPADVYAVIWTAAGGFGDPMERDPEMVRTAPHSTRVSRMDEVGAARKPVLRWKP